MMRTFKIGCKNLFLNTIREVRVRYFLVVFKHGHGVWSTGVEHAEFWIFHQFSNLFG